MHKSINAAMKVSGNVFMKDGQWTPSIASDQHEWVAAMYDGERRESCIWCGVDKK